MTPDAREVEAIGRRLCVWLVVVAAAGGVWVWLLTILAGKLLGAVARAFGAP